MGFGEDRDRNGRRAQESRNTQRKKWSGRGDSNSRSLDPQSSAITRLRYVPTSRSYAERCPYAERFRRAWGERADPLRDADALPRDALIRAAGIARARAGVLEAIGGARRNSSVPAPPVSSSRIDCRPRFTAVSRS